MSIKHPPFCPCCHAPENPSPSELEALAHHRMIVARFEAKYTGEEIRAMEKEYAEWLTRLTPAERKQLAEEEFAQYGVALVPRSELVAAGMIPPDPRALLDTLTPDEEL